MKFFGLECNTNKVAAYYYAFCTLLLGLFRGLCPYVAQPTVDALATVGWATRA